MRVTDGIEFYAWEQCCMNLGRFWRGEMVRCSCRFIVGGGAVGWCRPRISCGVYYAAV